jgi:Protein of unknown function (DUF1592)/Protein of unknown function (DUF1588)/Protein of unknown function (DUF1595)
MGSMKKLSLALGLVALTAACYAKEDDAQNQPPPGGVSTVGTASSSGDVGPNALVCDPAAKPPAARLKRLTTAQYTNTLRDLAGWALGTPSSKLVDDTLASAALPSDEPEKTPEAVKGSYRRLDQSLQAARASAYYQIGVDLGRSFTSGAALGKVAGACATDADTANDAACIDTFIRKFGARILRRPMTDADLTFYKGVYFGGKGSDTTQDPDAYADVLGVMLNSPNFLYFVEHGTTAVEGDPNNLALGPYELASRLSYQLWDTMPDDALFAAAADGSILTDAGYIKQVDRLFADPRTKVTLNGFFHDWIKAEEFPELDLRNNDPTFKSFAGANLPTKALREAMIEDAVETIDHVVWTEKGGLKELLTTDVSVNKDPELAQLYGVPAWNGVGAPPKFGGERPGLFTRAMFLATGSATTRPIIKGVYLRTAILCDTIDPPPANVKLAAPDLRPDMTTREVVEELTEKPGTNCSGCHQYLINPLGFATEKFDALGRMRKDQKLFDATGKVVGSKPVRTDSIPFVEATDKKPSTGPGDLMAQIAASPKPSTCLARNYFRFTAGRWETKGDACAIQKYASVGQTGSLADMLKSAILEKRFKQRMFDVQK